MDTAAGGSEGGSSWDQPVPPHTSQHHLQTERLAESVDGESSSNPSWKQGSSGDKLPICHASDLPTKDMTPVREFAEYGSSNSAHDYSEYNNDGQVPVDKVDSGVGVENLVQNTLPHVPEHLYIGMQFSSESEAYEYYNMYARIKGFSVRKSWSRKSRRTGDMIARNFVCYKEGEKDLKDKRYLGREVTRRRETREGCPARLYVVQKGQGKWIVERFTEEHNHILTTPTKALKLRSHNKLFVTEKKLTDILSFCGLQPSKVAQVLINNGQECVVSKQVSGHKRKKYQSNIGKEIMIVIKRFQENRVKDIEFFLQFELDDNCTIRSVFWADGRSRDNYIKFGDVVVFDTTYMTNNFKILLAPFTGVNHHNQSTLFGCALLIDETEDTFEWLFQTFLSCMCDKKPKVIITDPNPALRATIARVLEGSLHRFSSWQMGKNALNHVSELRCNAKFKQDYDKCIHESKTPIEFENQWELLVKKYPSLYDNTWLKQAYEIREHWIPCYLKDVFMAGMRANQQSKSMNSFFDGFVHCRTPISEFVVQYDRALSTRRSNEEKEDVMTITSKPILISANPIEKQAGNFYSRKIFTQFQEEMKKALSYVGQKIAKDENDFHYHVWRHGKEASPHFVIYNDEPDFSAHCSCKKFEQEGILCRHILVILWKKGITQLSDKYLLHRWSIHSRYYTSTLPIRDIPQQSEQWLTPMMLWDLRSTAFKLVDIASSSMAHYAIIEHGMDELLKKATQLDLSTSISQPQLASNGGERLPSEYSWKQKATSGVVEFGYDDSD